MRTSILVTLTSALAAIQGVSAADVSCSDGSNPNCSIDGAKALCKQAYSKFEDNVVYARNAKKDATQGKYLCEARLVCDSSIFEDGHIVYDRVSGYDIKVALGEVQKKTGCACGQSTVIQDNCWLSLEIGKLS